MKKNLLKKTFVICIIVLFFGVSIASSNIVKDKKETNNHSKSIQKSEIILKRGKTAYAYCSICPGTSEGPVYFDLEDPSEITLIAPTQSGDFLTGGTWANGYGWIGIEYGSGILWNIDPDTGEMTPLGGGISGLDIAWDDLTWQLYSCSGYWIYYGANMIELNTTVPIVSFAFNSEGICYGIDTITDGLHMINISTGEVTFVENLSISLDYYSNYISFDKDNDILYLLTDGLYIVNTETGECTLVGSVEGYELTAFAIPYSDYNPPPVTTISFDPPTPDGDNNWYISNVTASLNATDEDGVYATYYRINDGDWNTYSSPFIISEEGDNILIEFYSVDNLDNVEEVKSETLDIDKTPPEMIVNISKIKIGWQKWLIIVNVTFIDKLSGVSFKNSSMDKVEFYLNDVLQDTVTGPGPEYIWKFLYSGGLRFTIGVGAHICDKAGNCDDVYNETKIYFSRNKNQLINNQFFFRFLECYPLLCRLFQKFLL